jgi:hypothetical protein
MPNASQIQLAILVKSDAVKYSLETGEATFQKQAALPKLPGAYRIKITVTQPCVLRFEEGEQIIHFHIEKYALPRDV